jgi:hypothetical protein
MRARRGNAFRVIGDDAVKQTTKMQAIAAARSIHRGALLAAALY